MARKRGVDEHGAAIPKLVDKLRDADCLREKADYCLTTAHKAKGLEWDACALGNDFPDLMHGGLPRTREYLGRNSEEEALSQDDAMLLYVSATRPRKRLKRHQALIDFMGWWTAGNHAEKTSTPAARAGLKLKP